jgi:hypothetical protein
MTNYHLTPHGDGWKLAAEGSGRILDIFRTKAEAIMSCGDIIRERDGGVGSLKIHKADGTIEEERTFPRAQDPKRSAG